VPDSPAVMVPAHWDLVEVDQDHVGAHLVYEIDRTSPRFEEAVRTVFRDLAQDEIDPAGLMVECIDGRIDITVPPRSSFDIGGYVSRAMDWVETVLWPTAYASWADDALIEDAHQRVVERLRDRPTSRGKPRRLPDPRQG
jgi:hypothetical protein